MRRFLFVLLWLVTLGPALAVEPSEMLSDPALEARARDISKNLRCLVCQNQSIDDSNATLAHDLRVLVRQRLEAGDTNEQAVQYIVNRYGDFVLLRPPIEPDTYALWFGPPVLLVGAVIALALFFRRRRTALAAAKPRPLTAEEQKDVERLLQGKTGT
ncbi:MAG: cytochrome c-type biogenesis protein [Alphaproteobacteria bacterium]